jgi:DNA-binding response OmpR family regulator
LGKPASGEPVPREPAPDQAPQQAATTRTVLYIDDEPALRGLVERILTKDPAVVVLTAANASTGAQLAVDRQPDLILLDLHLAGVSGESLIGDLRASDRTSAIPIVVVSGDVSPQTVKRLADLGVAGHLAKPFDAERLRATITAAAERGA